MVRLQGVLTAAEKHLVKSLQAEKGRDLLKQVRTQLIETARPIMEAMIKEITGIEVLTLHHDISTTTGEEVVLFILAEVAHSTRHKEEVVFYLTSDRSQETTEERQREQQPTESRLIDTDVANVPDSIAKTAISAEFAVLIGRGTVH